jgi:hypothetical protein
VTYSVASDESTDVRTIAQLPVFTQEDFKLVEELLELVPVKGKTAVDEFFSQLVILLNKFELLWGKKWFGLSMTGLRLWLAKIMNGVATELKKK